jgi:hypothetical protein
MSRITLSSNTAGTGNFTIAAPNSNTNRTLTLPDEAGMVLTTASNLASAQLTGDVAAARITGALNATGDAPIYACRAWVNFNGTGTVAIRASGNVSSITDNGTGNYRVNFITAMPDTLYGVIVTSGNPASNIGSIFGQTQGSASYTTTTCDVATRNVTSSGTQAVIDSEIINVAIFR